jgi:hypothetical protein
MTHVSKTFRHPHSSIQFRWKMVLATCCCLVAFAALGADEPKAKKPQANAQATTPAPMPVKVGNGFRPHSASVYSRSALDNSHALHEYSRSSEKISKETVKEHLVELDRQMDNLKKEYAKLGDEIRNRETAKPRIAAVEATQARVKAQAAKLGKLLQTETTELEQIQKITAELYKDLQLTTAEHYRLLNSIQVAKPWYPRGMDPNGPSYDPSGNSN